MEVSPPSGAASSGCPITSQGAAELARHIAAGDVSCAEVVEAHVQRIEQVNGRLNAVVWPMFAQARQQAQEADRRRIAGDPLGPLHGVPFTVKECFYVAGTPATIGLPAWRDHRSQEDGPPVAALRQAGAIVLGKTNVPQLMIWHESDNPLYGRTANPWHLGRTAGGSSGGEAAIIAAGGSPLGLGSDMGGSIRVPCHLCGISGLKPTSLRLTKRGTVTTLNGISALHFQPGPMARRCEDLWLALQVLDAASKRLGDRYVAPVPLHDPHQVGVDRLRIGYFSSDGYFTPAPAVRRAVHEAAQRLRAVGADVWEVEPPAQQKMLEHYFGLVSADGGRSLKSMLRGSPADFRVRRMLALAAVPTILRRPLAGAIRLAGYRRQSALLPKTGPRRASSFWQLVDAADQLANDYFDWMQQEQIDVLLAPPHATVACHHGDGLELLTAACYSMVPNLLGLPAGVVAATRVKEGEESDRGQVRDVAERRANRAERQSAGLPVGVQVLAAPWREDRVLAVMQVLEDGFRQRPDYPDCTTKSIPATPATGPVRSDQASPD